MLYSQHFTFHWKILVLVNLVLRVFSLSIMAATYWKARRPWGRGCVLVSRIEKSGIGGNNFGKWKETFRSDRPK